MRLSTAIASGAMLLFLAMFCIRMTCAQTGHSSPIFKIGSFDRASAEFAGGTPGQPVNFIAGKSNPASDWYAWQPSEVTPRGRWLPSTNNASAPRTITFFLSRSPVATYHMHVALLIGHSLQPSGVPALRININGKRGMFYLHPHLDYSNGDSGDSYNPAFSHADVRFSFPGSYLHAGKNLISLQAIETADQALPEAGLTYDALELDSNELSWTGEVPTAKIEPTIFYLPEPLREIVDVFVRYQTPTKPGSRVELNLAGHQYDAAMQGDQDFGEEKLEFAVLEFPAKTRAQVAWTANGLIRQSEEFIVPKKKWTLFLVPHIHLDVGYSDYQAKVASIQSKVLDEAMDMIARHPDFHFSTDGAWNLEQFLKTRAPADQQRVISSIQKQQIFVPAVYAILHTGTPTAETLVRSLYPSANFSREQGTPFNYANITDVPSYSWSYASILASAGIKYLLAASDNIRGPVLLRGHLNESSPFRWKGPDGKSILVWYSRHYAQMQLLFGLPPVLSAGRDSLPLFLQQYEHPSYLANDAILFGTELENNDLFPQQAELAEQWNKIYAYPHLQYSGVYDAMKNIEQQFGESIPTISGDGGPYWEDGTASDAYYAAMERQNESRGPSAEKLATLTSLVNPHLAADKKDLDQMWSNMLLMDEHTWASDNSVIEPGSDESVQQTKLKEQFAVNARAGVDFVTRNSMASLADSISAESRSLIVFNTLNWKRDGPVLVDLPRSREIVDQSTGAVVPVDVLSKGNNLNHVRFLAKDVPPVGYKVFLLRPLLAHTSAVLSSAAEGKTTTVLESPYYRVTLDTFTGSVRSIFDKELQRELVDEQSPYRFGEYLYVTGGDDGPNTILKPSSAHHKPTLEIHAAHGGRLLSIERTNYGWVARMTSTNTNTPELRTEIRLFNQQKKIEFVEDIDKKEVLTKEAAYFAFPFAMKQPQFQYEIQTGVVDPSKDTYAGAGHEWFSIQHWIAAQQNGISAVVMPLDAALVTLGDINRGAWPTQFGERSGTIFSYVMNNYWYTNFRAGQGGHFRFRYVITSATTTNPAKFSRMGWEEFTPLEKTEVTSQDKALNIPRALSGKQDSFLTVSDPNLLLEAWKPAEDGNGTILRFLDFGDTTRTVSVQIPLLELKQGWQTDAVERNQHLLSLVGTHGFQFTIHPYEILTVRIAGKDTNLPPPI